MIETDNATIDFFNEIKAEGKKIERAILLSLFGLFLALFGILSAHRVTFYAGLAILLVEFTCFAYRSMRESKLSDQMLAASKQDFVDFENDMKLIQARFAPGQHLH